MIIDPTTKEFKITIIGKDGNIIYKNKDIPSAPFNYEGFVSCWDNEILKVIPVSEIKEIELIPEEDK